MEKSLLAKRLQFARNSKVENARDFYPTPPWVTKSIIEVSPPVGKCWEPACGQGHMSQVLKDYGFDVLETDLYADEYGVGQKLDFLDQSKLPEGVQTIITNPPFVKGMEFCRKAIELNPDGRNMMFTRLTFLESIRRYKNLYSLFKPKEIWVFPRRPTLVANRLAVGGGGAVPYCWIIWEGNSEMTELKWIPFTEKDFDSK